MARAAAAAVLLLVVLGLAVRAWLPSDAELAGEVATRFEKASGIALRVGSAHWALRPSPVVVLEDVATAQAVPITLRRMVVRPRLAALWKRSIAIESVEIEGAVLPRASVREFRGRWQPDDGSAALGAAWTLAPVPLERLRVRELVWIDRRDIALAYDADIRFDARWRPREAEVWRTEVQPPARLRLVREGEEDRWRTLIDVANGTWNGSTRLEEPGDGRLRVKAELTAKEVDVGLLVRSFGRRTVIEGRANGQTEVDAEGADPSELLRRLHSRTRFSIAPATLTGFDLGRAISSAGISRGGTTALDSLTGVLDTQAGEDGTTLRYTDLKARSGVLSASGNATVRNRRIDGQAAVDLVDGVVGVPLKLGGTLDAPELSLTGGALAGAAVGSAVLPGVGTAIGARIGQQVEQLFGGDDARGGKKAPAAPKSR
ncbi:AsmA-like C-terminal region-containing protein [Variovorax sp. J22P168]|uniref:AsmA-like C-terminal region-containing protein n=1 Tax=Variovorax jilinensis TaxID=3053513 RepID=UPI00257707C8|nr:AsmA-like C-terminal region-containing protein [Variovorax sp. J22P168]MDM0014298.1 AsmA-like C-terminal region-containing protein [Variovorax sp. J22P168]